MDIKKDLVGEFDNRLEELGVMKLGTEEYKAATDSLAKVADRIIEIEKLEVEREMKAQELKGEWIDRAVKTGVDVGKFGLSLAAFWLAFVASMNFEKEATLTTQAGRGVADRILNKLIKF